MKISHAKTRSPQETATKYNLSFNPSHLCAFAPLREKNMSLAKTQSRQETATKYHVFFNSSHLCVFASLREKSSTPGNTIITHVKNIFLFHPNSHSLSLKKTGQKLIPAVTNLRWWPFAFYKLLLYLSITHIPVLPL